MAAPRPVSAHTGIGATAVTPHHLATAAAVAMMAGGGNAVDAVIAANAVLGVVLPTTCGIGGDLFALVHRPGRVHPDVLNASGRAGSGVDPAALRASGHRALPPRAPETITVPGCVDGWHALVERHGTRPLDEVLAPAVALAGDGFAVSPELADDLARIAPLVGEQPAAVHLYPGGSVPAPGATVRRPDLADTLAAIGAHGRAAFYEGPVAGAVSEATGGIVSPDDLAANRPDWVDPIGAAVFGLSGWTAPPNSQGYLTLAAALLLEQLAPQPDPASPEFHHAVIESYRAVAWERDRLVSDPDHAPTDPAELVDPRRVLERAGAISPDGVAPWPTVEEAPGGTAYLCAIDADGMAASAIQSNYWGIGSGISAGSTGIFLHNRGAGFTLAPGHPNELGPGKRPLHTLSPTLWTRDGACALLLGTRGGHSQPQYLIQMVALMLHAGLPPDEAQAWPRWHVDVGGGDGSAILVEAGMPEEVVSGLVSRGHVVDRSTNTTGWGPVSTIAVDGSGTRRAAADPRVSTAEAAGE